MNRGSDDEYDRRAQNRFWTKVDKSGGPEACWPWTASTGSRGYGQFGYRGRMLSAHRFAMGAVETTPGLEACHSCGNRLCCNPAHLRLGTHAENQAEMTKHGTAARGERNGNSKLTEDDVRSIRREYAAGGVTKTGLAEKYGVSRRNVSNIVNRKKWEHVKEN